MKQGAEPQRHDDLGGYGDVERRAGVARALEPTGVRQSDGDEQPRHTEKTEQLGPEADDDRVGHAEQREQGARDREEQHPDRRREGEAETGGDVHAVYTALGAARPQVLARHGGGSAHQPH